MSAAAKAAGVPLVAGDTKVVEKGKADGVFINTSGVGERVAGFTPGPGGARAGDAVIVSGPIGRHGIAIMSAREGLAFEAQLESDAATLYPLVERLREATSGDVHALRDPTRGGVASALNEIAAQSKVGVELDETVLPIPGPVAAACEMLGLDPLYVANEGIFIAFLPAGRAEPAVAALRLHPLGREARVIGRATDAHPGLVVLRTGIGGTRVVDMLPGDQLPRIC
jgi:hydrogenase expression/formation protein HypE